LLLATEKKRPLGQKRLPAHEGAYLSTDGFLKGTRMALSSYQKMGFLSSHLLKKLKEGLTKPLPKE
jgi:hypothetical protein